MSRHIRYAGKAFPVGLAARVRTESAAGGVEQIGGLKTGLFSGVDDGAYMYFVHSYFAGICEDTVAVTEYGLQFSSALRRGNFMGCQFHPEKSGDAGERILANFLKLP